MFDRPSRHSSLETGELVLAQNDLDHAAPASASERAWTRCPETADGSIRTSEERRDLVEVYRKPFHRRFERGQGFAKFLGWRQRWSRMAGTIAQVGGRYGRPITSHSPVSCVIRSSRPHPGLSRPWWECCRHRVSRGGGRSHDRVTFRAAAAGASTLNMEGLAPCTARRVNERCAKSASVRAVGSVRLMKFRSVRSLTRTRRVRALPRSIELRATLSPPAPGLTGWRLRASGPW